jgi:hypothetical protein
VGTLLLSGLIGIPGATGQDVTPDPNAERLEVGDIRRLAQVLNASGTGGTRDVAGVLESQYFAPGSPGLRAYAQEFGLTAAGMSTALAERPELYSNLNAL